MYLIACRHTLGPDLVSYKNDNVRNVKKCQAIIEFTLQCVCDDATKSIYTECTLDAAKFLTCNNGNNWRNKKIQIHPIRWLGELKT